MKDRPAAKDLASFAKQLQHLDVTPEEVGTSNCYYLTHCYDLSCVHGLGHGLIM